MEYTDNKIDEALKAILLSDEENIQMGGLKRILDTSYTSKMSEDKKEKMLQKLKSKATPTFGLLLQKTIGNNNVNLQSLANKTRLPFSLLEQLINDSIVANDIPILIMKKILLELRIPVEKAATAITKTFEKLNIQKSDFGHGGLFKPAYRKNSKISSNSSGFNDRSSSELFENKDALNKYLEHLKELM